MASRRRYAAQKINNIGLSPALNSVDNLDFKDISEHIPGVNLPVVPCDCISHLLYAARVVMCLDTLQDLQLNKFYSKLKFPRRGVFCPPFPESSYMQCWLDLRYEKEKIRKLKDNEDKVAVNSVNRLRMIATACRGLQDNGDEETVLMSKRLNSYLRQTLAGENVHTIVVAVGIILRSLSDQLAFLSCNDDVIDESEQVDRVKKFAEVSQNSTDITHSMPTKTASSDSSIEGSKKIRKKNKSDKSNVTTSVSRSLTTHTDSFSFSPVASSDSSYARETKLRKIAKREMKKRNREIKNNKPQVEDRGMSMDKSGSSSGSLDYKKKENKKALLRKKVESSSGHKKKDNDKKTLMKKKVESEDDDSTSHEVSESPPYVENITSEDTVKEEKNMYRLPLLGVLSNFIALRYISYFRMTNFLGEDMKADTPGIAVQFLTEICVDLISKVDKFVKQEYSPRKCFVTFLSYSQVYMIGKPMAYWNYMCEPVKQHTKGNDIMHNHKHSTTGSYPFTQPKNAILLSNTLVDLGESYYRFEIDRSDSSCNGAIVEEKGYTSEHCMGSLFSKKFSDAITVEWLMEGLDISVRTECNMRRMKRALSVIRTMLKTEHRQYRKRLLRFLEIPLRTTVVTGGSWILPEEDSKHLANDGIARMKERIFLKKFVPFDIIWLDYLLCIMRHVMNKLLKPDDSSDEIYHRRELHVSPTGELYWLVKEINQAKALSHLKFSRNTSIPT